MDKATRVVVVTVAAMLSLSPVWACDSGTVRDAAFYDRRDVHRLCVIGAREDASAADAHDRLDTWLQTQGKDLNLDIERVNADDDGVHWAKYGIPTVPPRLPVVALVGEFSPGRSFVIDHWEPAPTEDDLAVLLASPARARLTSAILESWAVILYSPGADEDSRALQAVFDAVEKRWAVEQAPGVSVVRFDRADPRERLLCNFIGIEPSGPDWAGVVFGRGKLLAPPLQGEEISEDHLNQLFQGLAVPCTCLQESLTLGLDIPMAWHEGLDAKVTSLAPPQGYMEMTIGDVPPMTRIEAELEAQIPDEEQGVLASALVPLAGAGCLAIAAMLLVWWRVRRRNLIVLEK